MVGKKSPGGKDIPETTRREIKARVTDLLEAMRDLRPEKVMTNVAVASRLGVGKSAVSNWADMSARDTPSLGTLIRICQEYSVTLDYLVFGSQDARMSDRTMEAIRRAQGRRVARTETEPETARPQRIAG